VQPGQIPAQFVMAGFVPAIHAVRRSDGRGFEQNSPKFCFVNTLPWPILRVGWDCCDMTAWMAGTSQDEPAMTEWGDAREFAALTPLSSQRGGLGRPRAAPKGPFFGASRSHWTGCQGAL
jgi:hypothetical protein